MALKVALKFLKNFKILKKLSLKKAIFKRFWGFFACFYAILAFRDNRVFYLVILNQFFANFQGVTISESTVGKE